MANLDVLYFRVFTSLWLVWKAAAQASSNVSCTTELWTFNAESQSPCQVAASLEQPCIGGMLQVTPLSQGRAYSGPLFGESNKCICSSVTFSMISACGACQNGSILTWNQWITNCSQSDISISTYPFSIPSNTSVPSWAYINVSLTGVWDKSAAESNSSSGAPDSSAGMPTSTSMPSSSSSHPSHTGAIAGGVVGGAVGLVLVILAGYVLCCRRRYSLRGVPIDQFEPEKTNSGELIPPNHIPTVEFNAVPAQTLPPKLYDPSDPSTFPPTPQPALPAYTTSSFAGSEVSSPTLTGAFSPTSTSHSLISDRHSRNLSGGTTVSTAMQSAQHGRNLSGGTTTSSVLQEQVGYSGAPEI